MTHINRNTGRDDDATTVLRAIGAAVLALLLGYMIVANVYGPANHYLQSLFINTDKGMEKIPVIISTGAFLWLILSIAVTILGNFVEDLEGAVLVLLAMSFCYAYKERGCEMDLYIILIWTTWFAGIMSKVPKYKWLSWAMLIMFLPLEVFPSPITHVTLR